MDSVFTSAAPVKPRKVWFTGTTALRKGMGLCYDWNRGTVTAADGERFGFVELPNGITNTNNYSFAGWTKQAYPADANGQFVYIYEPGSICEVLFTAATTAGQWATTRCTSTTDTTLGGYHTPTYVGMPGRGTVRILQTVASATDGAYFLAECQTFDGPESGLLEVYTPVAGGGAVTPMVGGATYFAACTIAANATFTQAAGTFPGQFKLWYAVGEPTTSNIVITVTGLKAVGTALATVTMEDIADGDLLMWTGTTWASQGGSATEA